MEGPLLSHPESSFQKKLAALKTVADQLPCVIIVLEIKGFTVEYMSRRGLRQLGTTMEHLKALGADYVYEFFNPKDVDDYLPKIERLLKSNDEDEVVSFFQQVRFAGQRGWNWHLSTVKIFMKDENGQPSHCIVTAHTVSPFEHVNAKVNRLLEENTFLRENQAIFLSLTRREREVLRLLAFGKGSDEIAGELFISPKTVKTHRKNLRKKLNAQSNYDITRFAQAFDLI